MVELRKLVEKELSPEEDSKELIQLWNNIHSWYEEGGPDNIASNLRDQLKDAEKEVSQNIKTLPEVQVRKKSKKRRK